MHSMVESFKQLIKDNWPNTSREERDAFYYRFKMKL